jgi:hypothetical protein
LLAAGLLPGHAAMLVVQRVQSSNLYTESTCRPLPLATRAQAAQSLDQHGIGRERRRRVDERVENLVVARRRHVEQLANGLFLGASVLPPLTLERQYLTIATGQAVGRFVCVAGSGCGVRGLQVQWPPT